MKTSLLAAALLLSTPHTFAADAIVPVKTNVPAGAYTLDRSHASLIFRVNHMGFSNYTARFKRFDAKLQLDPKNPSTAHVEATIDVSSLETDFPTPEKVDFNAELLSDQWLNAGKFPQMTFKSTAVEMTGPDTARIKGELSLHGITKPLVLDAKFNGGYPGQQMDPNARIGFSARTGLKRSDFGVSAGIPAPGTTMGVSDAVEIIIEAEFTGPPLAKQ